MRRRTPTLEPKKREIAQKLFREMTEQRSHDARLVLADLLLESGFETLGHEVRRYGAIITRTHEGIYPSQRVLNIIAKLRRVIGDLERRKPKKTSDIVSTEQLAGILGIPTPEEFQDNLFRYDLPEEEEFEAWRNYHNAVSSTATALLGRLSLDVVEIPRRGLFRIVPATKGGWLAAAEEFRNLINGYGPFYFQNAREFLSSGPYTPREAVLSHLGWTRRYSEVYGEFSAERIFERAMRR